MRLSFYLLYLQYLKISRYRTYVSVTYLDWLDKIRYLSLSIQSSWDKRFAKRAAQPWKTYESANDVNFIGQRGDLIIGESRVFCTLLVNK